MDKRSIQNERNKQNIYIVFDNPTDKFINMVNDKKIRHKQIKFLETIHNDRSNSYQI